MTATTDGLPKYSCGLKTSIFLSGRPSLRIEEFLSKLKKLLEIAKLE